MGISIQGLKIGHVVNVYGEKRLASGPNSVGGIDVVFGFTNTGTKTIKYASFYFIPYNSVGDAVTCSTRGESEQGAKYTGFVEPGASIYKVTFNNAWYNSTITQVKVSKVFVEYTDGTNETINGSDVPIQDNAPSNASGGCYVATAVYGSYDCPQVWTLRRYRDYELAETWYGRTFIRVYYAISPILVKWFGHKAWFKKMWRVKLDRMVNNLQKKGYDSTPYKDRNWKY